MAAGRVCISTPFDYAKEALADKRGIIVPAEDSEAIAKKIIYLIKHPKVRHRMENLSYKYARGQTWFKTAKQYSNLFSKVVKE
jgi:glycosyltransferase involved in cell wall biosynthesis